MRSARESIEPSPTRRGFRILAGIVAGFLLLVGVPCALSRAFMAPWESLLWAVLSLYAGIGLALGARTGRWFGSKA